MSRTILVAGSKGGVGKTTTALNLAACLSQTKKVLLIDSNLSNPDIGIHLGAPHVPIAIQNVLSRKNSVIEAIYRHHSGLHIMPASLSLKNSYSDLELLNWICNQAKTIHDLVIVDSSATINRDTLKVMYAADEVIAVTTPELPAVTGALRSLQIAEQLGKTVRGAIITRCGKKGEMSKKNMQAMLNCEILGKVPEDNKVRHALHERELLVELYPESSASQAYRKIATKLLGETYIEKESFLKKLWGLLRI